MFLPSQLMSDRMQIKSFDVHVLRRVSNVVGAQSAAVQLDCGLDQPTWPARSSRARTVDCHQAEGSCNFLYFYYLTPSFEVEWLLQQDKDLVDSSKHASELSSRLKKLEVQNESSRRNEVESRRSAGEWKTKYQQCWKEYDYYKRITDNLSRLLEDLLKYTAFNILRSLFQMSSRARRSCWMMLTMKSTRRNKTSPTSRRNSPWHVSAITQHITQPFKYFGSGFYWHYKACFPPGERERRATQVLDLQRSKQDRSDQELQSMRDLYAQQERDISLLQLNLEGTKDLLHKQQERYLNKGLVAKIVH